MCKAPFSKALIAHAIHIHRIALDCIEKLVKCVKRFNKGEINADISFKISKQILVDEFDDEEFLEFAIENYSEMFGYITTGKVSIKIHKSLKKVEELLLSAVILLAI